MNNLETAKFLADYMKLPHAVETATTLWVSRMQEPGFLVKYQPHKNWEQLMSIVSKIENSPTIGSHLVTIEGTYCNIQDFDLDGFPHVLVAKHTDTPDDKIQVVYEAVVEFLKRPQASQASQSSEAVKTFPLAYVPYVQPMITCAAILYKNIIYPGRRHCNALKNMVYLYNIQRPIQDYVEGFLTNTNSFVTREEAGKIVLANGQVAKLKNPPELFSEELY